MNSSNPNVQKPARAPVRFAPADGVHERGDCARVNCSSNIGLYAQPEESRDAFAKAHGFIPHAGKYFCSQRCYVMHSHSPDGNSPPVKPLAKAQPRPSDGSKLRTWDAPSNVEGRRIAWVGCGHVTCPAAFEVPVDSDRPWRAGAAMAHGYLESAFGVYCGSECAQAGAAESRGATVRDMPAATAPSVAESFAKSHETSTVDAMFADTAALVTQRGRARNQRVALSIKAGDDVVRLALVETFGHVAVKNPRRRALVIEAETMKTACVRAMASLDSFLAGVIGSELRPGEPIDAVMGGAQ